MPKTIIIPDIWIHGFTLALPGRARRTISEAVTYWRDQEIMEENRENEKKLEHWLQSVTTRIASLKGA